MKVSPAAGKPAEASMLVNVPRLVTAYYTETPDPSVSAQRVAFGTSGHRGSAFEKAFNERHILAISQAICLYRAQKKDRWSALPGHGHPCPVGARAFQRA
jgi:phosphoglucomutase